jgi:hypothetical protein
VEQGTSIAEKRLSPGAASRFALDVIEKFIQLLRALRQLGSNAFKLVGYIHIARGVRDAVALDSELSKVLCNFMGHSIKIHV